MWQKVNRVEMLLCNEMLMGWSRGMLLQHEGEGQGEGTVGCSWCGMQEDTGQFLCCRMLMG